MPWAADRIPKYRKHRASGQAVVTIAGRDYYLGPHGTKISHREYDRLVAEWLASGRANSFGALRESVSVVELIADYVKYARSYYSTGRTSEYHRVVRVLRRLRELYGRTQAGSFGAVQFKAVRQTFMEEDLSRSYVNENMQRVVRLFTAPRR